MSGGSVDLASQGFNFEIMNNMDIKGIAFTDTRFIRNSLKICQSIQNLIVVVRY